MRITINIPDEIAERVLNGFAKRHNFTDVSDNDPQNRAGKVKFIKDKVLEFIKRSVNDAEIDDARRAAAEAAAKSVEDNIILS